MSRTVFSLIVILTALETWVNGKLSSLNQQIAMQSQSTLPLMDATVCRTVPGFTKAQQELCFRQPEITSAALQGLADAMQECQYQFQGHRWNCSTLANKQNPYTSTIFHKGYRETAFAYALSAAGVTISVARACSQGSLNSCGCDHKTYRNRMTKGSWKWGGCSHNLKFGVRFSKMLLDNRDKSVDLHSKINTHNNEVGRRAVADNMQLRCKCHGMSGSCEIKTCWRSTPDLRQVGKLLKDRFRIAVLVDQSNLGNDKIQTFNIVKSPRKRKLRARAKQKEWTEKVEKKRHRKDLAYNLVYYQRSPNFCEKDQMLEVTGTVGRQCLRNSTGADNCSSLCCGRGYNLVRRKRTERCNCKFMWCCQVECQVCTIEEWITVCK